MAENHYKFAKCLPAAGLRLFILSWITAKGYPLAVVGVASANCGFSESHLLLLAGAMDPISFSVAALNNPCRLDWELAVCLREALPAGQEIIAVGATIYVAGGIGPTGGILGSPRQPFQPAAHGCEALPHGLALACAPGGPGLVMLADPLLAYAILNELPIAAGGTDLLQVAVKRSQKYGVSLLAGLTDGTDVQEPGSAVIMKEKTTIIVGLSQPKPAADKPLAVIL